MWKGAEKLALKGGAVKSAPFKEVDVWAGDSSFHCMLTLRQRLGRAIRRLRTAAGYSQESFADACGLHRTYMGTVERGERNISLDNIERIAKTLKMGPAALLSEAEKER